MQQRATALVLCLAGLGFAAAKKPVTLEALASAKPPAAPEAPVWSGDGARFVYKESGKLWLYDMASRSRQTLTALTALEATAVQGQSPAPFEFENRRVREQPVQWTPSGGELLLGAGGDLFLYRLAAGGWTQLTATPERERDPKLSPDGRAVSFRRGHDLYVLDLAERQETRLTHDGSSTLLNGELDWVYPEELALGSAHWWSPDSRSIAYLQFDVSHEPLHPHVDWVAARALYEPQRYPRAGEPNASVRLGVQSASGGATRWMDLGETRDSLRARVWWLPDSKSLLAVRLNRVQNRLDLLRVDAATGESRVVLTETDPHWINPPGDVRFLRGGQEFLWESERDGFKRLYRYAIDGRQIAQLTRGDGEVTETACVDEAAGQVYYVSSEASPLERRLYRIGLDGGARVEVSRGAGTHAIRMSPGCVYYLDRYSSLTAPPRSALHSRDGAEWAVLARADDEPLEQYEVLPSEIVELKAGDGTPLYGRLTRPAGFQAGRKYPAIVNVYGGPGAQQVRNAWPGVLTLEQALAQRGYIVWTLDNRGSSGRGHKFESAVFRNLGENEVEDQREGVRRLISLGLADPARVGVYGWSYGGYMTLRLLLKAPDMFACGVAGAPVADWRNYDTIYTERYMGLPAENPEGYRRASNLEAAAGLQGGLLLVHNVEDDNVLFQNTMQMAAALERAGKQFELMIYPGKSHALTGERAHYNELLVSFFDRRLGPAAHARGLDPTRHDPRP